MIKLLSCYSTGRCCGMASTRYMHSGSDSFPHHTQLLTSAKRNICKLLPRCWIILKVAVRLEVQRIFPRVPQTVVDSGRYTDLVAGRNTVASNSLGGKRQDPTHHTSFFLLTVLPEVL